MRSNQLSAVDLGELVGDMEGRSTDVLSVYVFDSGAGVAPGREEVLSFFRSRASRIPALRWTVTKSPGGLAFPYWTDSHPFVIEEHVTDNTELQSWDQFLEFVRAVSEGRRDRSDRLWRIHVVRGIADAPNVHGEALAVVLEASHALGDGLAYNAIARELFSSSPLPEYVAHLDAPNPWVASIRGLLGTPRRYVKAFRALPEYRRLPASAPDAEAGSFSGARALGVITLDASALRRAKRAWPGATVTSVAQVIVALAVEEYFGDRGPSALWVMAAAPEGMDVHGRNRLGSYQVDTSRGAALPQRIVATARDNHLSRKKFAEQFPVVNKLRQAVPAVTVRRQPLEAARLGVVISSIDRGPATMTLSSARIAWTADFPYVSPETPVSHGIYSVGDVLTISVLSGTDALADIRDYISILESSAAQVLACLRLRSNRLTGTADRAVESA